ncbi:MAG: hypothetical protein LKG27_02180 [Clostridiaceae bacterium]|jgi:hypothetical protein|nr:hypothetical protein [Clostridiaceae bacterium]
MLLIVLKYLFIAIGSLLAILITCGKLFVFKLKDNILVSNYTASIAGGFFLYAISAISLIIFAPNLIDKMLMLMFGLSPFIIGNLATYEKENVFTVIQIITAIASVIFVINCI